MKDMDARKIVETENHSTGGPLKSVYSGKRPTTCVGSTRERGNGLDPITAQPKKRMPRRRGGS